jgi:hypothetical protein
MPQYSGSGLKEERKMAKAAVREGDERPSDEQAEVDKLVQPLADYLVEHSDKNLPIAHRAGQLLRDTSALIVTVASSPEIPEIDNTLPEPEQKAQKAAQPQKMAPLYEPAHK